MLQNLAQVHQRVSEGAGLLSESGKCCQSSGCMHGTETLHGFLDNIHGLYNLGICILHFPGSLPCTHITAGYQLHTAHAIYHRSRIEQLDSGSGLLAPPGVAWVISSAPLSRDHLCGACQLVALRGLG